MWGVGEAIAVVAKDKPWLEKLVLSDYNLDRVREVHQKLGSPAHMPMEFIDAGDRGQVISLIQKHQADLLMNAVDPVFNEVLFDAAFEAGINYMDMAMTLLSPHTERPLRGMRRQAGRLPVRARPGSGRRRACWRWWAWSRARHGRRLRQVRGEAPLR